jgi:hypothetical protein
MEWRYRPDKVRCWRPRQRLKKLLEDAGIKLPSVASDITGASGRLMVQALIEGQRDPPSCTVESRLPSSAQTPSMGRHTERLIYGCEPIAALA